MLKACPEVHHDGADLHLDGHRHCTRGEKDRDFNNRVQTLIAIRLRVGDAIFDFENPNIILRSQGIQNRVGVCNEATGDPDPGDISKLLTN